VVIDERRHPAGPHFDKTQIADLLAAYDRIAFIDTDTLVGRHCPNLFDIVPRECFGAYIESGEYDRQQQIETVQRVLGRIHWTDGYFNSGVMIASRAHAAAFGSPFGTYVDPWFFEQTLLNYNVRRLGFRFHALPKAFNHFAADLRADRIRLNPWRFGAYLIHYAGPPAWAERRLPQMDRDDVTLERVDRVPFLPRAIATAGALACSPQWIADKIRYRLIRPRARS